MYDFKTQSGNFINDVLDDIDSDYDEVLESVMNELDCYDMDDDIALESLVDMVMEGNPNNRHDATKAGVLAAKLREKSHRSSDKRMKRYYDMSDRISNKYNGEIKSPDGKYRNYYANAKLCSNTDIYTNIRKKTEEFKKKEQDNYNKEGYGYDYGPYKSKVTKKKATEDSDYDEFDMLVDQAIEEAEYEEASEGIFSNEVIASVYKFKECGMSDKEAKATMKALISFAIRNDIAKKDVSLNAMELRKHDLHYFVGNGGFLKSFLNKWYRIAENETSKSFEKMIESSYDKYKKERKERSDRMNESLEREYDRRSRVEAARAGAARININNSNSNYASAYSKSNASIFESVDYALEHSSYDKGVLNKLLQYYLNRLEKHVLRTAEDCDDLLTVIKRDQIKYNKALETIADARIQYAKNRIDAKEYKKIVAPAANELKGYYKTFKIKISDITGVKLASKITKEDVVNFKHYVAGLIVGVNDIKKKKLVSSKNMDSANEATFEEIFNIAMESLED